MDDNTKEKPQQLGVLQKVLLGVVGVAMIGAAFAGNDEPVAEPASASDQDMETSGSETVAATDAAVTNTETAKMEAASNELERSLPDTGSLTGPQRNAVRTAQDYIELKGFSRTGLIEQLSSEYGSGYNYSDAEIAVDGLNIDWNYQAVRSAQAYLDMMGFSCSGLIEQLSSDYGDGFTVSQASYGAAQAGAC